MNSPDTAIQLEQTDCVIKYDIKIGDEVLMGILSKAGTESPFQYFNEGSSEVLTAEQLRAIADNLDQLNKGDV